MSFTLPPAPTDTTRSRIFLGLMGLLGIAVGVGLAGLRQPFWVLLILPLVYVVHELHRRAQERLDGARRESDESSALYLKTIEALALAIESKDDCGDEHLSRVQVYSMELGRELGLNEDELKALHMAAILHDIGNLAVPDYIISKPGELTAAEFEKVKIHPAVGANILERVNFPYPVAPLVRAHHEKWDGSGYPAGQRGEEIPLGARILSAVVCLDALASDRQYRPALPLGQALQRVIEEAAKAFDPRVVQLLVRRASDLEVKAKAAAKSAVRMDLDLRAEPVERDPAVAPQGAGSSFVARIAQARHEVSSIHELTRELGTSLSLEETLCVLGIRLQPVVPHDCIAIYLRQDDRLRPVFVSGENAAFFSSLEIPLGEGLAGWAMEKQQPVVNGNPSVEAGYLNDPAKFSTLRSALAIPLDSGDHVPAVLTLYHARREAFELDHVRILQGIQGKLSLALANALKYKSSQTSATEDALTGVLNGRALFLYLDSELGRAKRHEEPLALLVCDLNGFRALNAQYGQNRSDRLLRRVAEQLKEMVRGYDGVGRLGGNEFVVVMPGLEPGLVPGKATEIEAAVAAAAEAEGVTEVVLCCTGYATYPQDGQDAEDLLAVADRRLHQAKASRGQATGSLAELDTAVSGPSGPSVTLPDGFGQHR